MINRSVGVGYLSFNLLSMNDPAIAASHHTRAARAHVETYVVRREVGQVGGVWGGGDWGLGGGERGFIHIPQHPIVCIHNTPSECALITMSLSDVSPGRAHRGALRRCRPRTPHSGLPALAQRYNAR